MANFLKKDRPTWKQTPWRHLTFRRSPAFSSLHPCLTKASQQNRPPRCPNGRPSSRSAPLKTASARSRSIVLIRIHNATCWRNHTRNPTWLFGPWMRLHFLSIAYNPELMKGTNQWRWLDNDQPWAPPNLKLQRKHSLQLTLALVIDVGYENQWVKANWVLGILQADWKAYVFCTFESIYTNMLQWVQSVSTWSCAL